MQKTVDVAKYRKLLVEQKKQFVRERKEVVDQQIQGGMELSDYSTHPADAGTDTFEKTKDYAIEENYKDIIDQIDLALKRIDEGTYGCCERCGKEIAPPRLKAIPYAVFCIECQELVERG